MKQEIRESVAFILNLFPGLGFHFSGTMHNLRWLRLLGSALIAAFLIIIPITVVLVHPYPLINYHFTASEWIFPLTIALISGMLGAVVEYKVKEKEQGHE